MLGRRSASSMSGTNVITSKNCLQIEWMQRIRRKVRNEAVINPQK